MRGGNANWGCFFATEYTEAQRVSSAQGRSIDMRLSIGGIFFCIMGRFYDNRERCGGLGRGRSCDDGSVEWVGMGEWMVAFGGGDFHH